MENIQFIQTTPNQLADLIDERIKASLQRLKDEIINKDAYDDLLNTEQACKLLDINASTLWHWRNAGKIVAFGVKGRRYYKRSQIMEMLTELK